MWSWDLSLLGVALELISLLIFTCHTWVWGQSVHVSIPPASLDVLVLEFTIYRPSIQLDFRQSLMMVVL